MVKTKSQRQMWQTNQHKARRQFFQIDASDIWVAPIKPTLSNNGRREHVRVWPSGVDWIAEHWTGYTTRHRTMHDAMDALAGEVAHG